MVGIMSILDEPIKETFVDKLDSGIEQATEEIKTELCKFKTDIRNWMLILAIGQVVIISIIILCLR